jgi:DNA-binding MarR family transcriptional regulator
MGPPSTATDTAPHTDLDSAIAQLQTELNRQDRTIAAELGVGSAEDVQMLRLLATTGPMRVGHIAGIRSAGKATVSARVDRLERNGFVTRERDRADRRAVTVALTALGESKAAASRSTRRERLRPISDTRHTAVINEIIAALRDAGG